MTRSTIVAVGLIATAAPLSAQLVVHDAINENAATYDWSSGGSGPRFMLFGFGWYYTPQTSFYLSAISTRFGSGEAVSFPGGHGRFSVWSDAQGFGGRQLAAPTGPAMSWYYNTPGWHTTYLTGPFAMIAGTEYFIALDGDLDENAANFAVGTGNTMLRSVFNLSPIYSFHVGETAPILRFEGPTYAVPEPGSALLLATGLVVVVGAGWRRRRAA